MSYDAKNGVTEIVKVNCNMKELDVVKLIKEFNGLPIGIQGAIVSKYDGTCYEVEFFDANGDTVGVFTTPCDVLELVVSD